MAIEIEGICYYSATEVANVAGVSRQTLWRWRQDGKIPAGHRFRDRQVLFTEEEVEQIMQFANRLEPCLPEADPGQLRLFDESKAAS